MPIYVHYYKWVNKPERFPYPPDYKPEYAFKTVGPFAKIDLSGEYLTGYDAEDKHTTISEFEAEERWDYDSKYIEKSNYFWPWHEADGFVITTSKNPPKSP